MNSKPSGYLIVLLLVLMLSLVTINEDVLILLGGSSSVVETFSGNETENDHTSQSNRTKQFTKAATYPQDFRLGISDVDYPVAVVIPFDPPFLRHTDPITNRLTVNWIGFTIPGMPITHYRLYYRFNEGSWHEWGEFPGTVTSAEFVIPNEDDGVYEFEATAVGDSGQVEERSGVPEAFIFVDRYPPYIQDEWVVTLYSLQKNTVGLSSRYEVTNTSTQEAITAHAFYDINDNLRTFLLADIPPGENRTYDLATIAELTDGFRGYVVIYSEQPIEAILLDELLLAQLYAPRLYRHEYEWYWPIDVGPPVNAGTLHLPTGNLLSNPTLDHLADPQYNHPDSFLNFPCLGADYTVNSECERTREGSARYWDSVKNTPAWYPQIFARIRRYPWATVIQYWFFFFDNPGVNYHEGDWEMVEVILDSEGSPELAAYSQHFEGTKRLWEHIEEYSIEDGTHPQVFYARGSHASYFRPYPYRVQLPDPIANPLVNDEPGSTGVHFQEPRVVMLAENEPWLAFQGHWGHVPSFPPLPSWLVGPRGPAFAHDGALWHSPYTWGMMRDWDELADHNINKLFCRASYPGDVFLRDNLTGEMVGRLPDGTIVDQIPTSEYLDNNEASWRTILVHTPRSMSILDYEYLCEVTNIDILPFASQDSSEHNETVTIPITITYNLPQYEANQVTTIEFLSVTLPISATATITSAMSSEPVLLVDEDGDGTGDYAVAPTTVMTTVVDFTPPNRITDLTVVATEAGSVTLTWTAPGDDKATGSATAYDIRYDTEPIDSITFGDATPVSKPPAPGDGGSTELFTVTGMLSGTYYLAIQAIDDAFQFSGLSNVVEANVSQHKIYMPVNLHGF